METVRVPLTQGKVAIIDAEDAPRILQHKWFSWEGVNTYYAARNIWTGSGHRRIDMHREIFGAKDGELVDHRDGNGLNNRKGNLRECSRSQNQWNRQKNKNNSSGYKGVYPSGTGGWRAAIRKNGTRHNLGTFPTPVDAARAYDAKARELHGEFARLNFPNS